MRTQGTRWQRALVGLVIVACGHAPPPRVPERDDDRAGATELVWDPPTQQFAAESAIDASAGDTVDWYTLTLPPEVRSGFTVYVDGIGRAVRLPMRIEVRDGDARAVGRVAVEEGERTDLAYAWGLSPAVVRMSYSPPSRAAGASRIA